MHPVHYGVINIFLCEKYILNLDQITNYLVVQ